MTRARITLLLLMLATPIAACRTIGEEIGGERAVLRSQLLDIEELVRTGEPIEFPENYVRYFSDSAILVTAPGSVIQGKQNIRAFYERVASNVSSIEWETSEPTILIDGSLAVLWYKGVTRVVYAGQDSVTSVETRYVDVMRKHQDGSWKIMMHSWTRD